MLLAAMLDELMVCDDELALARLLCCDEAVVFSELAFMALVVLELTIAELLIFVLIASELMASELLVLVPEQALSSNRLPLNNSAGAFK